MTKNELSELTRIINGLPREQLEYKYDFIIGNGVLEVEEHYWIGGELVKTKTYSFIIGKDCFLTIKE